MPLAPLLSATARLLRPLVRLLIRGGVTCPTLMDVLRGVYVEVAQEMVSDPRARTDSRISLMTGVHRKELRRQRKAAGEGPRPALTVGCQVAARWLGMPGFQDTEGRPLPLPRTGARSFETLVAAVTRDVRPRAVLDDWLAQGLVAVDCGGALTLQVQAFAPRQCGAEELFAFGRNLHDHIAAAAATVGADAPAPFLDCGVHYDGLSADAAAALTGAARQAAERMLEELNRSALAIAEADGRTGGAGRHHRVNLGTYLFGVEEAP